MIKSNNEYITSNDVTILLIESPKYGAFEVLFNTKHLDKVKQFHWHINYDKSTSGFYVKGRVRKDIVCLHRIITNCPDGIIVDHINHNSLDNRDNNLRICTNKQNMENLLVARSDNKSSGIRGVTWNKQHKKWQVSMTHKGKRINGGYFLDILLAEQRAIELRRQYFTHSLI